jgi:hypothetical protein
MSATPLHRVVLKERDQDVLRLLDRTPATAPLILKASGCFTDPFEDLRRVRERMHALSEARWVRSTPLAATSQQALNWYRLTPEGYRLLHGEDCILPHKTFFMPSAPSRQEHSLWLAQVIVQTMVAAAQSCITIADYRRENSVVLTLGTDTLKPDGSMQLRTSDGREFNFFLELDNGTEPIVSPQERESIERKVRFYERLQDSVLAAWRRGDRKRPPPRYRVLFFMRSMQRNKHVLRTARQVATNPERRLCLGVLVADYLSEGNPLRSPMAVDHHGRWQGIVSEAYEAQFQREPLRLETLDRSLFPSSVVT